MANDLTLETSININAPASQVWNGLTDPELIKQYFFGTECITDWKKGSKIIYRGIWEGKEYEDKGNILDIEKEKFIKYNYWSSFSGTEDKPENYAEISYRLQEQNGNTLLTVIQGGIKSEEARDHSKANWDTILNGLKNLIEKKNDNS
jgi:uncharacterized protein YndB with AHSA1/START domain